ncbi:PD-(D/E)XK motif protein [Mangrovibacterium lignilyticum]|uniref:PD-(D/E)XK motif protein n=1 Tax=Mangrovibacterium lignilyticum TaxID=2668052 RepID=UPI0013D0A4B3|nr:PD-(D/E)XK motif protein [Mangrovibacterium lignilyticum]
MDFKKLSSSTWDILDQNGDPAKGYKTIWLAMTEEKDSGLHIFKDKLGYYHFAIATSNLQLPYVENPNVNGLQIQVTNYQFANGPQSQFIDLCCSISGYLEEFTQIVTEISEEVLVKNASPKDAVTMVITNWLSFWSKQKSNALSETEQLGLISELLVLDRLCLINSTNALKCWRGPLNERHDFNFSAWSIEVKGTTKENRIHLINGVDQLKSYPKKRLGLVSCSFNKTEFPTEYNLNYLIKKIKQDYFPKKPDLAVAFNNLLAEAGYSPLHNDIYDRYNLELIDSMFFEVNETFPKLTSEILNQRLDERVSGVNYKISLNGMTGIKIDDLRWGEYFF